MGARSALDFAVASRVRRRSSGSIRDYPSATLPSNGDLIDRAEVADELWVMTRTSRLDEIELNDLDVEVVEGQEVEVPSAARVWMLEQLESIDRAQSICDALAAVEATRPVTLGNLDRAWLLGYLEGSEASGTLPAELRPVCDGLRQFGSGRH